METCKKCGRNLPEGYKHKLCQHCMNKVAYKVPVIAAPIAAAGIIVFKTVKGLKKQLCKRE